MKHGSVASLALCSLLLAAPMVTGCCKKSGSSSSGSTGTTGELVTIPSAGVKFNAPGGWYQQPFGDWIKYVAPDKYATIAFVAFDKPGESTRRIGEMVKLLGLAEPPDWGSRKAGTLGPNSLKAQIGDGPCKLAGGDPCYFEYATINTGVTNQLLMVYVVNTARGSQHKPNASAAVRSISKL